MKKYIVGAILSVGLLIFPAFTQAAGLSEIQIQAILSLLSSFGANQSVIDNVQVSLTGGTPTIEKKSFCHNFNKDLTVGSRGDEVSALNQALTASGIDTTGNSANFSEDNAGDVVAFQAKYGIRQTGYVGPMTRAKLNALHRCRDEQKPTFVPQPIQPHKSCPTTMDIISCEAGSHAGGLCNRECIPDNTPTLSVSEQVKCVFNGATTEQKCWNDIPASTLNTPVERYICSGVGTCVVTVAGSRNTSMTWGSSCGGSSTTSIDGTSEYANFSCKGSVEPATFTASPTSGPAPLWVTFTVGNYTPQGSEIVDFGDGTHSALGYSNSLDSRHDYNVPGTYKATLLSGVNTGTCPVGAACAAPHILGSATIIVTNGQTPLPVPTISEQVKCVFNGATTEQKCWGTQPSSAAGSMTTLFNCSGIGTCVVTVNGQKGTPIHWGSSCGGSSTTSIDGGSEYANFSCANIQTTQTIQPTVI